MKITDISKSFDGTCVLDGLSISFPKSGFVGISGPSGSGKTTLLRIIAGLESPDSGSVEERPDCIAMQFEDDRLFPWMDVLGNVMLAGCDEARAQLLLDSLGLADKIHARIDSLSGGQRRRVALARALAFPAPLYIFDEPTARLDAKSTSLVLDVIWQKCAGKLVILASHDEELLGRCDEVYKA